MKTVEFYEKEWLKCFGVEAPKHLSAEKMNNVIMSCAILECDPEEVTQAGERLMPFQYFSEEVQIMEVMTLFDVYDSDGDGVVDYLNLKDLAIASGVTNANNKKISKSFHEVLSKNQDVGLSFEAYYYILHDRYPDPSKVVTVKNTFRDFVRQRAASFEEASWAIINADLHADR